MPASTERVDAIACSYEAVVMSLPSRFPPRPYGLARSPERDTREHRRHISVRVRVRASAANGSSRGQASSRQLRRSGPRRERELRSTFGPTRLSRTGSEPLRRLLHEVTAVAHAPLPRVRDWSVAECRVGRGGHGIVTIIVGLIDSPEGTGSRPYSCGGRGANGEAERSLSCIRPAAATRTWTKSSCGESGWRRLKDD